MIKSRNIIATPPGETIKEQLLDKNLSQKEFSVQMGMSEKHISKLINGEIPLTPAIAVQLETIWGIPAKFWNNLEAIYREKIIKADAEQLREKCAAQEIKICTVENPDYPHGLRAISGRPSVLYYKGDIALLNRQKSIAVIGTRNPSEQGLKLAFQTGRYLAEKGITVVNGLAIGCDTEALRGALTLKGKCAVFLPCGLDEIVPYSNRRLAEQILSNGGCLVSEYSIGTPIQKYQYAARNRLQSGASDATLIIETGLEGGTMHTARFAIRQHKHLLCYDHRLVEKSAGNQYLLQFSLARSIQNDKELGEFVNKLQKKHNMSKCHYSLIFFNKTFFKKE